MGGFVAVPHCIKAEFIQSLGGEPVVNVIHYRFSGSGGSASDLDTFAGGLRTQWLNFFIIHQSNDLTLTDVICTDLTAISSPQGSDSGSDAGTDSGDVLSSNAAACISWREAIRYRGGHGRMYLGGITQATLSSPREFDSGFVTALQSDADDFRTTVSGTIQGGYGAVTQTILHARFSDTHPVPPNPTFLAPFMVDVDAVAVNSRVDSQRRRLGH